MVVNPKFPALSALNDGFDENDRWRGMTPDQVRALVEKSERDRTIRRLIALLPHIPSSVPN